MNFIGESFGLVELQGIPGIGPYGGSRWICLFRAYLQLVHNLIFDIIKVSVSSSTWRSYPLTWEKLFEASHCAFFFIYSLEPLLCFLYALILHFLALTCINFLQVFLFFFMMATCCPCVFILFCCSAIYETAFSQDTYSTLFCIYLIAISDILCLWAFVLIIMGALLI